MIYLITGTPGAGKSLYAVSTLIKELMQPVPLPDGTKKERRLVVDGIPNLALDHTPLAPGKVAQDGTMGPPDDGHSLWTWYEWCQPGDLIVIDECQRWWRPRGMGTKPPLMVQKLETHRHLGVDFIIITQSAALLDQNVRRLVERHTHVRRAFGGARSVLYDWDGCQLNTSAVKTAQKRLWSYPKDAFKLYTSSTLHIKPKHKLPIWIWVFVLAAIGLAALAPKAYNVMYGTLSGKGVVRSPQASSAPAQGASSSTRAAGPVAAGASAPALPPLPGGSAPAGSTVPPVLASRPPVMGCAALGPRCACYGDDGHLVDVPEAACRSALATAGGLVSMASARDSGSGVR